MSLGTSKERTAYLALLGEVLQRPGHHYIYHHEMEYRNEKRLPIQPYIGAGFTARAFYYNKDNRGKSNISIYYKSGLLSWYIEMKYENSKVSAIYRTGRASDRRTISSDAEVAKDSFYSFAVRCLGDTHLEGYVNKTWVHKGSVSKISGYEWDLTLQNEHQKLLSVHLTFEDPPAKLKVSDYWGTKSYLKDHWVPTGTVGVFQCVLVDKSAEHWLKITDYNGYVHQVEFESGSLTKDSELCYNIRLSPVAYIVTTSFDYTTRTIYEYKGAHYIKVEFSPAVYIKRYDMKIPYFTP
ncbi:uncharacterized protein [Dermacentor albipictus]|uniref:uncharacterized protein isoform X1 n=2 Tax=Dermacentor albipictus TaxID=60249 RepID=UPI0031FE3143